MPFYEFCCTKCGTVREKFYRIIPRTTPLSANLTCNKCAAIQKHNKIISSTNFHLGVGGVGWAEDGYSGQNPNKIVAFDEP